MKTLAFFGSIVLLINGIQAIEQGKESSFFYPSSSNSFNYSKITDIIVFGDSYSNVSTNYTTMAYSGENMSLGKNWGLYFAEDIHPMKLWGYAYDGAVIDTEVITALTPEYAMTEQYEYFLKNMSVGNPFEHEWNSDSTIFAIWFGINDIIDKMLSGANTKDDTFNEEIDTKDINSMFNMVQGMYVNGARNFLFFYVPPIDKAPFNSFYPILRSPEDIVKFNKILKGFVEEFKDQYPDTNVFIYNSYNEFHYILENHSNYNITEINNYCTISEICSNPENYYWADAIHPTFKVHEIIAKDIDALLNANSIKEEPTTSTIPEQPTTSTIPEQPTVVPSPIGNDNTESEDEN